MKLSGIVVAAGILSGCAVGRDYQRPALESPQAFRDADTQRPEVPASWWTLFRDPTLDALQKQALSGNLDLQAALARIGQARAGLSGARADFYPSVNAEGDITRQRISANAQNLPPGLKKSLDLDYTIRRAGFDMNYELDLWGKVRRSAEAARAGWRGSADDYTATELSISAEVARTYFELRSIDREREVLRQTVALREDEAHLEAVREKAGLSAGLNTTRAAAEAAVVQAQLAEADRRRAAAEHALAVLCGAAATDFRVPEQAWQPTIPQIVPGLPSDLLRRRPDLRRSEQALIQANAEIGVAKASFFPSFQLLGSAGLASLDASTLLDWESRVLSFGPSVTLPIFRGGRNRAQLKRAEARYQESLAQYKNAWLTALRETEDALSDLKHYDVQSQAQARALANAEQTWSLAKTRYNSGLTNYLDVIDAQRVALQAKLRVIELDQVRQQTTVQLVKAIGGGMDEASGALAR